MRHLMKWMLLPVALAGAMAANAGDFCEDDPERPDWNGAGCPQKRSSLPPEIDNSGVPIDRKPARPNYSTLDLRRYYPTGYDLQPIAFTLELDKLNLQAPATGERETAYVEVLKLGLLSHELVKVGQNGYRVLTMSIVREARSATYLLDFSWTDDYEPSMPIGMNWTVPVELNSAVAVLWASEKSVDVTLSPVDDWSRINVEIDSYQRPEPYDVPLIFEQGHDFRMPSLAQAGFTQPWTLTSGIVAGDLKRIGMTTNYLFRSPDIRMHEAPPPAETYD
jgi:hypothetical protein